MSKSKSVEMNLTVLSTFMSKAAPILDEGAALKIQGKWVTFPSAKSWPEVADTIKALKEAGFKSAFYRGHKVGVRAEHVGLPS
jgi:hypothetical protein